MSYTTVFGGDTVAPAEPLYLALALTADTTLQWPLEQALGGNVLAKIIDVTATGAGHKIALPDATIGSTGYVTLLNNIGADSFDIVNSVGGAVATIASGEAWSVYLANNTTSAGVWRIFQAGAGTSSANAATLAGAGLVAISSTLNEEMEILSVVTNYAVVNADRAKVVSWGGAVGAISLPDPATVGANWFVTIKNAGSGSITITPAAGSIDGGANLILATTESSFLVSDGVNYLTVGFGQNTNSIFDFISIPVPGTGNFVLSGAQLNRVAYEFTGILTGNRVIIVPSNIQQYWVTNHTTGAFTLTVKTAAGTGVGVAQNTRAILYCDGTNVVNGDDASSISFPILPTQGGTGLAAYAQGDTLYASAVNTLAALPKDTNATRYLANTGASNNPNWDQVNLTNGVTGVLPAANYETSGSFTATLTGMAALTQATMKWRKIGNIVILYFDGGGFFTGTSNNADMQMTGLPAAIQPSILVSFTCPEGINNGALRQLFIGTIQAAASAIQFGRFDVGGTGFSTVNFTAAGSKGFRTGAVMMYPLS